MSDVKPLTDEELETWRKSHAPELVYVARLIATIDEKERQRAAAVARRESELKAIEGALRNHHLCKPDCTVVTHIAAVYSDLGDASRRMRELHDALRKIADDHVDYGESFEGQFLSHKEIAEEALKKGR